jgi:alpha-D-ribose 1-methylphosphonate 5-triphosphate synthase subunit PhnH
MALLAATPVPDAAETRSNATFEALMWALSRPGTVQHLPGDDPALISEALVDRECHVWCADPVLAARIAATGAQAADPARADHVFLSGAGPDAVLAILAMVAVGSDLYPDAGATVILPARFGSGPRLRLTGPGIETEAVIAPDDLPPGLWSLRAARCRYPMGFDLFLTAGAQVIGLPRSTRIEVL